MGAHHSSVPPTTTVTSPTTSVASPTNVRQNRTVEERNNTTPRSTRKKLPEKSPVSTPGTSPQLPSFYQVTHSTDHDVTVPREITRLTLETEIADSSPLLLMDVMAETASVLHLKIRNPHKDVHASLQNREFKKAHHPQYDVEYKERPFGLVIRRKTTGYVLFESCRGRLECNGTSSRFSTYMRSRYVYGLAEMRDKLVIDTKCDDYTVTGSAKGKGHPFVLALEEDGNAYGFYVKDTSLSKVKLRHGSPSQLTYTCNGSSFDLYLFTGPSPIEVVQQYQQVVGLPHLPPYWALGLHQNLKRCQFVAELNSLIENHRRSGIPYESQWADIDLLADLPQQTLTDLYATVNNLHVNGQKFIPCINSQMLERQLSFIHQQTSPVSANGDLPGRYKDGHKERSSSSYEEMYNYWLALAHQIHQFIPFDGLYLEIDKKSTSTEPQTRSTHPPSTSQQKTTKTQLISNNNVLGYSPGHHASDHRSTCLQHPSMPSISTQLAAANDVCQALRGRRSLLLSCSTCPGSGRFTGHCLETVSKFGDLRHSISAVLESNIYGIPLVGADMLEGISEELAVRWTQMAAFFPFLRNSSSDVSGRASSVDSLKEKVTADVVSVRYSLLPYLYTLLYEAHTMGTPVIRSLFMLYPKDKETYSNTEQFMWGSYLLFSPCLSLGKTQVNAYFPFDIWYDFFTGHRLEKVGSTIQLAAPQDHINIHIRGGSILLTQTPSHNTAYRRRNPFGLLAALDSNHSARGKLYWDDGDSLHPVERDSYNLIRFYIDKSCLTTRIEYLGCPNCNMQLKLVQVCGLFVEPDQVFVNGSPQEFTFNSQHVLQLDKLNVSLAEPLVIKW